MQTTTGHREITNTCSESIRARGLGRLLSGLPQTETCKGKPVVILHGRAYCRRHSERARQYLAAKGNPANVVWLDREGA